MCQMHGSWARYIVAPEVGADSPQMGSRSALLTTGRALPSSRRGPIGSARSSCHGAVNFALKLSEKVSRESSSAS